MRVFKSAILEKQPVSTPPRLSNWSYRRFIPQQLFQNTKGQMLKVQWWSDFADTETQSAVEKLTNQLTKPQKILKESLHIIRTSKKKICALAYDIWEEQDSSMRASKKNTFSKYNISKKSPWKTLDLKNLLSS